MVGSPSVISIQEHSPSNMQHIKRIFLYAEFNEWMKGHQPQTEHFRVCLQLLDGPPSRQRCIVIGGRDDYWRVKDDGDYIFGVKTFLWRCGEGSIANSWVPESGRVGGGYISGIHIGVSWIPISPIPVGDLEGLYMDFFITENLARRIKRVRFEIDDYEFLDRNIDPDALEEYGPNVGWPSNLTKEEEAVKWLAMHCWSLDLKDVPRKVSADDGR